MTNEEAIKDLKRLLRWYVKEEPMSETMYKREAVQMAIEALERSEKFQQKAEVVISQLRADRDRLADAIEKIRAEISEYGSIWVQYTIKGTTNKDIEDIVENTIKQAKNQVLYIIDKHTKESEES